jgi:hypothetical protein
MLHPRRNLRRPVVISDRDEKALYRGLWVAAGVAALYFGLRQYMYFKGVVPGTPIGEGGDFFSFLTASRQIATGHSPYDIALVHKGYGYVYSPFLAILLLPVHTLSVRLLWRSWIVLSLAALAACAGLVTWYGSRSLRRWHRPVFFAFAALTALDFGPTKWELYNGQTDAFVLLLLVISSLAAERDFPGRSGVLMGAAAAVKTWPVAVGLTLLRRGQSRRRRAVLGFVIASLVAPVLALAIGGTSGIVNFFKVTVDGSSQPDPSYSVWGTPKVLFSVSRLAVPLTVSPALRILSTIFLVAVVGGLLVLVLRWSDSSLLSYWNVVGGVVLLLPVSHLAYTMYFLPLLWIWALQALSSPTIDRVSFFMTVLMVAWWCFMYRWGWVEWPEESSFHYMYPFFADFVIFTASVLCDHFRRRALEAAPLAVSLPQPISDSVLAPTE